MDMHILAGAAVLVLLAAGWSIEAQRIGALDRELDMLQTRAGVAGVEAAAAQRLSAAIAATAPGSATSSSRWAPPFAL